MRVLLVSANTTTLPYPVYPLGAAIVAQALETAGHEVRMFDFLHRGRSERDLRETIRDFAPGIVGISMRNIDNGDWLRHRSFIDSARLIVSAIKDETGAPVVVGGSGFSLMPDAILYAVGADFGIAGEGETAFTDFVNDAEAGLLPDARCIYAPPILSEQELIPPRYDREITAFYLANGGMSPVQTKRGCTHRCSYCSYPLLEGRTIRPRTPRAVVDDVERLIRDHGAEYIFFADSVFNDAQGHFRAVVREMQRRAVTVRWTAFFRPSGLDQRLMAEMKQTGLSALEIGADAPSDTTLAALQKDFRFVDVQATNELCLSAGIPAAHYFIFGGPGETPETVREGIENVKGLRGTVNFVYMGIRIYPNTSLADRALQEGIITPGQDLLHPVHYFSPGIDREWLGDTLTEAFENEDLCLFADDDYSDKSEMLLKVGYRGPQWDLLLVPRRRPRRQGTHHGAQRRT